MLVDSFHQSVISLSFISFKIISSKEGQLFFAVNMNIWQMTLSLWWVKEFFAQSNNNFNRIIDSLLACIYLLKYLCHHIFRLGICSSILTLFFNCVYIKLLGKSITKYWESFKAKDDEDNNNNDDDSFNFNLSWDPQNETSYLNLCS